MRGAIPFRGVGIPAIREALAGWRSTYGIDEYPLEEQLELALALFEESVAEDKLAGILFLQEYLYDKFPWEMALQSYAELFQRGLIFDWNTCDWFCVRVLGPTIALHGEGPARALASWASASDLWQARAGVVAFVKVAEQAAYYPLVSEAMVILIQRPERFAKTAVGWLLREISQHDEGFVHGFINANLEHFSLESLKNASKYFPQEEQEVYNRKLKLLRNS